MGGKRKTTIRKKRSSKYEEKLAIDMPFEELVRLTIQTPVKKTAKKDS